MADYQIILNAAGWLEKGVLSEDDLMEIQAEIDAQYVVEEPETVVEAGDDYRRNAGRIGGSLMGAAGERAKWTDAAFVPI